MELLIGTIAVVTIAALLIVRASKNNNGVNSVEKTVSEILDVNKDGKVNVEDAKALVEKAKTTVKKTTVKPKPAAKKATTRGRRPKA